MNSNSKQREKEEKVGRGKKKKTLTLAIISASPSHRRGGCVPLFPPPTPSFTLLYFRAGNF